MTKGGWGNRPVYQKFKEIQKMFEDGVSVNAIEVYIDNINEDTDDDTLELELTDKGVYKLYLKDEDGDLLTWTNLKRKKDGNS